MSLTIDSGETKTLGSGETLTVNRTLQVSGLLQNSGLVTVDNVRELNATATDADTATATTERVRDLSAQPIDSDTATATTNRIRELSAGSRLIVGDGETETISTATTEASTQVSGRLVVTDNLTLNGRAKPAQDAERALATTNRVRDLSATATDTDKITVSISRIRGLSATATDADSSTATATRVRELSASAADEDTATVVFFPLSEETDPRAMVVDILNTISIWPCAKPNVEVAEDVTRKAKENRIEPSLYVYKDGSDDIERFSADGLELSENESVRVDIWILSSCNESPVATISREYRNRVVNIMSAYMNDNYTRTEFHGIEPVNSTDFRQQNITRKTDHYIYSVEIETHRLKEAL